MEHLAIIAAMVIGMVIGFLAGRWSVGDLIDCLTAKNDVLAEMNRGLTEAVGDFLDVEDEDGEEVANDDEPWIDNTDWWKQK